MILSTSRMHVRDLSRPVAVYVTSMQKMTAYRVLPLFYGHVFL